MSLSDPVLRDDIFLREDEREVSEQRMTIGGTINKTLLFLALLIISGSITGLYLIRSFVYAGHRFGHTGGTLSWISSV
ncbi:hypothetical protein ACFQ5D_18855 [Paenibacillus farraposensis]|uniref:Uncharacterized protein n=1 Tax=Paenibacillus farraposensis TaxID=2807095 RepID=A0ABW4DFG1_9BACL|nr:hypothetical protein [Paenibacillus farraposensis]